jgi:hypothetical protein
MNIAYQIYQAERPRTAAEQREADIQVGELAASAARLGRSVRHAFTGTTGNSDRAAALRSIPRPR